MKDINADSGLLKKRRWEFVITREETKGSMMNPEGEQETAVLNVSAQRRNEIIHVVDNAQDISGQTAAYQTRNSSATFPVSCSIGSSAGMDRYALSLCG